MPKITGKRVVCDTFYGGAEEFGVTLYQRGVDRFAVHYGKQVDDDLTYGETCAKLGQAIMHALSCDGKIDNRDPRGPRRHFAHQYFVEL